VNTLPREAGGGDAIGQRELAKTLKRLGPTLDGASRQALETLVASLVRKLYHDPIVHLKLHAQENSPEAAIDFTRAMFNLDGDRPRSGRCRRFAHNDD